MKSLMEIALEKVDAKIKATELALRQNTDARRITRLEDKLLRLRNQRDKIVVALENREQKRGNR